MIYYIGSAALGLVVLTILYFIQLFIGKCHMLRKFKGPLAFPLIGNCYSVEALSLLRYLSNLRRRFGRIFTFFALSKPYLVICDPIVVRRVLSDTKTFVKGSDYTSQFSVAFGTGLVTSNGEKHKSDRACFGKYFIRSNIAKYMSRVNDITVRVSEVKASFMSSLLFLLFVFHSSKLFYFRCILF